jgi:hypothetical protein
MMDKTHKTCKHQGTWWCSKQLPNQFRFLLFNKCFISTDIMFWYRNMMTGTSYIYRIQDFFHKNVIASTWPCYIGLKINILLSIQFLCQTNFL